MASKELKLTEIQKTQLGKVMMIRHKLEQEAQKAYEQESDVLFLIYDAHKIDPETVKNANVKDDILKIELKE